MKVYVSRSTVKQSAWDRESCPDLVYHHTDITEHVEDTEGASVTYYEYVVTEYTAREYVSYVAQQANEQCEQIKTIAELTDVDLEADDPSHGLSLKERINDLEIAICELLDSLA